MSGRLAKTDSSAPFFITGATGYIGRRLVRRVLEDGERVHLLSRRQSDLTGLQREGVRVFCGDVTDRLDGYPTAGMSTHILPEFLHRILHYFLHKP